MKTSYQNIAMLDARNVSQEQAAEIEEIKNVSILITSAESQPWVHQIPAHNVALTVTLSKEVRLWVQNGKVRLTAESMQTPVFLVVNGNLSVDGATPPEALRSGVCGGMINGSLTAGAAQLAALAEQGVTVNGHTLILPDGFVLREGEAPLSVHEAQMLKAGRGLFFSRKTALEKGVAALLAQKQIQLDGAKGLIVHAEDAQALGEVFVGDPSKLLFVPEGYGLRTPARPVTHHNARSLLHGKVFVPGDLIVEQEVSLHMLSDLEALEVRGKLVLPLALMPGLIDRVGPETEWVPYEGRLLVNRDQMHITPLTLKHWPAQVSLFNEGVVDIDGEVDAQALGACVTLLMNDGVVRLSAAQQAALAPATINTGHIAEKSQEGDDPMQEAGRREATFSNAAMVTL